MPFKKSRLQLYADECFPVTSVTYLRSRGISITHAFDKNLVKKSDRLHLKYAKKISRALITLDRDFIGYDSINLKNHPGIIIISVGSATPNNINSVCDKFLRSITPDFAKNSLLKVTRDKITKIKDGVKTERVF